MAEINDLEDTDDLDDLGLGGKRSAGSTGFLDQLTTGGSGINRRFFKIGVGVIVLILVVGVAALSFSKMSSSDATNADADTTTMTPAQMQAHFQEVTKKKKKEQKKRRIKYEVLFKALEGDVLSSVLKELTFADIPFSLTQSGDQYDVSVDTERLEEAKNLLAVKGLPTGATKGYSIFDNASNLGVTEFDKRIRLVRAISGEMEKSINTFEVISDSRVSVVIPEERLFAAIQPPVTASILLKRAEGRVITDEVVFAVIQLVANSVENLSPSNITVVDTEGHVLSSGVIERVGTQQAAANPVNKNQASMGDMTQKGVAVLPDMDEVSNWFQVKYQYETILEQKATKQLEGVLPKGAYKVAVTVDLDGVSSQGSPDIKQIITSVVVDNTRDDIDLDASMTQQVYNVISGAIGYVRGRDTILLSKANFESTSFKSEAKEPAAEPALVKTGEKKSQVISVGADLLAYWQIPVMGGAVLGLLYFISRFIKWVLSLFGFGKKKIENQYVSTDDFEQDRYEKMDLSPMVANLKEETPVMSSLELTQITKKIEEDPMAVASVVKAWLSEEGDQNG